LATAACMAGDDDDKIQQLPDTTGMKNEILIQTRHRYWYDRCLELAGGKLVQFGTNEGTSRGDLESAIGPNTAAVHYYAVAQEPDEKALSLEDTIELAHANNIPVLVDAAGQIYPLDLFGNYVRSGADFQCIAAKYMGSPQSTGLALGSVDMIRKLALQSFVSYEGRRVRGVGRPHKVDRQEMVGAVAAVKRWVTLNHEERLADIEEKCRNMMTPLQDIPGVTVTLSDNVIGHQPYGVILELDENITGISCYQLVERLKQGNPPIWTRVRDGEDFIILHAFGLAQNEDIAVGRRIAEWATRIG
jgi:D-glucosaminate-6-phosphate ammonia-lyase